VNVSTDPRTIKIFGNGEQRSGDRRATRSGPRRTQIFVSGESDGRLIRETTSLLWARGPWLAVHSTGGAYRHHLHHYTESNIYWLTYGVTAGKRMTERFRWNSGYRHRPDHGAASIEEEKTNPLSGKDWLGQTLSGPTLFRT
jgi:hypothetical protein